MKWRYNPFPLVFSRGDEPTKLWCLEFFGLSNSTQAKECLLKLVKQQRADGCFVSNLDPEHWGIRETSRNVLLLLKGGLPAQGPNVHTAVTFILNHQNDDGGWSENHALRIPPSMVELSSEQSVTWVTADIIELLRQVGMGKRAECRAALRWLRSMQNRHGGWYCFAGAIGEQRDATGDPDSSAQITFLMREVYGERDEVYVKGRTLFEEHLDETARDVERGYWVRLRDGAREELDVYHLTHLLLSWPGDSPRRLQSGYDVSDHRVKRMMEALVAIQREDGGWRPFFSEQSSPLYTVLAVKVLILSGALSREGLSAQVEACSRQGSSLQRHPQR
jgi:hypothetical protein